jgi:hypothetical protein
VLLWTETEVQGFPQDLLKFIFPDISGRFLVYELPLVKGHEGLLGLDLGDAQDVWQNSPSYFSCYISSQNSRNVSLISILHNVAGMSL